MRFCAAIYHRMARGLLEDTERGRLLEREVIIAHIIMA